MVSDGGIKMQHREPIHIHNSWSALEEEDQEEEYSNADEQNCHEEVKRVRFNTGPFECTCSSQDCHEEVKRVRFDTGPFECTCSSQGHHENHRKKTPKMMRVKSKRDWKPLENSMSSLEDYDAVVKTMICEVIGDDRNVSSDTWENIEAAVDSAAVDCVMPWQMLPHIRTVPSERSKAGRHYVAANNQEIRNRGQRKVRFTTDEGQTKSIGFQSAEVSRTLISVDKLNDAGCDVMLNRKNPRIVTANGEVIKLRRKGGVFILNLWVKIPARMRGDDGSGGKSDTGKAAEILAPVFPRQAR